jgi:hypothetical protein
MRRLAAFALLLLPPALVVVASRARGGESPAADGAAPPPRVVALDLSIRHLEGQLAHLRRARKEVVAGRAEPSMKDDAARRAISEVARYEVGRARALERLREAEGAADEGARAEAKSRLDALDAAFLEAMRRIDEAVAKEPKPDDERAPRRDARR